jgi:Flp pilus assembly pilin Flp
MTEYVLIIAAIAVAGYIAYQGLEGGINTIITSVTATLSGASEQPPTACEVVQRRRGPGGGDRVPRRANQKWARAWPGKKVTDEGESNETGRMMKARDGEDRTIRQQHATEVAIKV